LLCAGLFILLCWRAIPKIDSAPGLFGGSVFFVLLCMQNTQLESINRTVSKAMIKLGDQTDDNRSVYIEWGVEAISSIGWFPKFSTKTAEIAIHKLRIEKPCDFLSCDDLMICICSPQFFDLDTASQQLFQKNFDQLTEIQQQFVLKQFPSLPTCVYVIFRGFARDWTGIKDNYWTDYYRYCYYDHLDPNIHVAENNSHYTLSSNAAYYDTAKLKYNAYPVDEEGMPMIPEFCSKAVSQYIIFQRTIQKRRINPKEVSQGDVMMERELWENYMAQAIAEGNTMDWYQAMEFGNKLMSMIPQINRSRRFDYLNR